MNKGREWLRTIASAALTICFFLLLFAGAKLSPIISAILSVALYFGLYYLLKPTRRIGKVTADELRGGENSITMMEEARKDLDSMKRHQKEIKDPQAAESAKALSEIGGKILAYLTEHPKKIADAHRFATYYLDMAEKLEGKFVELEKSGLAHTTLEGSDQSMLEETRGALGALETAFDRQYQRLAEGELMQVEADIQTLHRIIDMEGDK